MKLTLLEIDAVFCNQYKTLLETQRGITRSLEGYKFDLDKDEITQAVIQRMFSFWQFNVRNCEDLGRNINTGASDFFTETCLFFIKQFFKQYDIDVFSEKNILKEKSRKNIRPDLSIWKDNQLIAVIELKVSDGWKGKGMLQHLEQRKNDIQQEWPNTFFGTISFWDCFSTIDNNLYPNYFGILIHDKNYNHQPTGKTIEQMLKTIIGDN